MVVEMNTASTVTPERPSNKSGRSIEPSVLGIPKPPFEPPHRRSSLGFSRLTPSPGRIKHLCEAEMQTDNVTEVSTRQLRSNVGVKRRPVDVKQSVLKLQSIVEVRRVFETASTSLHRDMHYAACPDSSISSRLPMAFMTPSQDHKTTNQETVSDGQNLSGKSWRYSTVPSTLAKTSLDVREPVPSVSPDLPVWSKHATQSKFTSMEPPSSGFASPLQEDELRAHRDVDLLPVPPSSPTSPEQAGSVGNDEFVSDASNDTGTELERPLTGLRFGDGSDDEMMEESPILEHLRRKSGNCPAQHQTPLALREAIFLSSTAEAAAKSARAKRGLLRQTFPPARLHIEPLSEGCPDPALHKIGQHDAHQHVCQGIVDGFCPNIQIHQSAGSPTSHAQASLAMASTPSPLLHNFHQGLKAPRLLAMPSIRSMSRTTASGSPMPFPRLDRRFPPDENCLYDKEKSPTLQHRVTRSCRPNPSPSPARVDSEHFQPGWYYAKERSTRREQPGELQYSFSTAAAKVTGESPAPDSRIRDSYRTDTLTPLAKPVNRYRKTGIGAELQARPTNAYQATTHYWRRPSVRSHQSVYGPMSSPPRPSTSYSATRKKRSRTQTPEFFAVEDRTTNRNIYSSPQRSTTSHDVVNDDTRAAIRMSLFGPETPEPLQGGKEELQELSPNVNIWRRGLIQGPLSRKKRRPSYWDADLEEVKMSPAAQGDIASSPALTKRSMVAEVDSVTDKSVYLSLDGRESLADEQVHHKEGVPTCVMAKEDVEMTESVEGFDLVGDDSSTEVATPGTT